MGAGQVLAVLGDVGKVGDQFLLNDQSPGDRPQSASAGFPNSCSSLPRLSCVKARSWRYWGTSGKSTASFFRTASDLTERRLCLGPLPRARQQNGMKVMAGG